MRIALGSDHAGFELKDTLKNSLIEWGVEVLDLGANDSTTSVDYPDYGAAVGHAITSGKADLGVAVCGSGIGISIAANKVAGIRAALVHDVTGAHLAREHNHANVLCFGSRLTGSVVAIEALRAWLDATPGDGRHLQRIDKLSALDSQENERD